MQNIKNGSQVRRPEYLMMSHICKKISRQFAIVVVLFFLGGGQMGEASSQDLPKIATPQLLLPPSPTTDAKNTLLQQTDGAVDTEHVDTTNRQEDPLDLKKLQSLLKKLQERQKRVEVAAFPVLKLVEQMKQLQIRLQNAERSINFLEGKKGMRQPKRPKLPPSYSEEETSPGTRLPFGPAGADSAPEPEIIAPPSESDVITLPSGPEVVVSTNGYELLRAAAGRMLWTPQEVEAAQLSLPAASKCAEVGEWLYSKTGDHRKANIFFVRSAGDIKEATVCEEIENTWQFYAAESGQTGHVITLKSEGK